jgi:hypothetical protein
VLRPVVSDDPTNGIRLMDGGGGGGGGSGGGNGGGSGDGPMDETSHDGSRPNGNPTLWMDKDDDGHPCKDPKDDT